MTLSKKVLNLLLVFFFVTQQSLALVLLSTYPLIAKLSGLALTLALNCASVAKNVLAVSL